MWWRAAVFASVVVAGMAANTASTLPARLDVAPIAKAEVERRLEGATVALVSLGCDLSLDSGTGVDVAGDRVLSNRHVAERFRTLQLVYDGTPPRMVTPGLIGVDQGDDVAVLRPGGLGLTPIALSGGDPSPRQPVWVSGYAHDRGPDSLPDGLVVAPGRVVDYVDGRPMGQKDRVMRVSVPVRSGMSGGAVLDQTGRLAGLVFAVEGSADEGLVIPVSVVKRVLQSPLSVPTGC
ncbi:MAG: trypsin-like peptidase domain-containing protein [Acidimicrobiia bacterium]|nr:trypsin-like peptidase domain-containing protein [Acidimicrobiia bacterium]